MKVFSCVSNYGLMTTGGAETYFARMYKWAKIKGYSLMFFMQEGKTIGEESLSFMEKENVSIFTYEKYGKRIMKDGCRVSWDGKHKFEESLCIACTMPAFVAAHNIFLEEDVSVLFYVLLPSMTHFCNKRILSTLWAEPFYKSIKDTNLVFMDEGTRMWAGNYYPSIDFSKTRIARVGMIIPVLDLRERERTYRKEKFTIVTVARFEFPFKGYVCGLIDTYKELKKTYANMELVIIGVGEDKKMVDEKLESLSGDVALDIHLAGYVEYGLLEKYMKDANLFVGMGTTVLDAAKYGVPGIVATVYQMGDYSSGFFASDYTCLGKLIDDEGAKKFHFKELIEQVYQLSEDGYLKLCRRSYDILSQHYDLNNVMAQLLEAKGKNRAVIPKGMYFFWDVMQPLWLRLKGNIKQLKSNHFIERES